MMSDQQQEPLLPPSSPVTKEPKLASALKQFASAAPAASASARKKGMSFNTNKLMASQNLNNIGNDSNSDGDQNSDAPEDDDDSSTDFTFTDDLLIRMTVLSRVVERYRFIIPSDNVDDEVNEDTLLWMFELDAPLDMLIASRLSNSNNKNLDSKNTSFTSNSFGNSNNVSPTAAATASENNNNNNNESSNPPVPKAIVKRTTRGKGWARLAARVKLGDFAQQYEQAVSVPMEESEEKKKRNRRKKVIKTVLDAMDNLVKIEVSESDNDDDNDDHDENSSNRRDNDDNDDDTPVLSRQSSVTSQSMLRRKSSSSGGFSGRAKSPSSSSSPNHQQTQQQQQKSGAKVSRWKNLKSMPLPSSLAYRKHQEEFDKSRQDQLARKSKGRKKVSFADVVLALIQDNNISAASSSANDNNNNNNNSSNSDNQNDSSLLKKAFLDGARQDEEELAFEKEREENPDELVKKKLLLDRMRRVRELTKQKNDDNNKDDDAPSPTDMDLQAEASSASTLQNDDSKTSLASAAGRFAFLKVTRAVNALSGLTVGAVKSVSENVKDSVKEISTSAKNVAQDLGIVKKTEYEVELRELASDLWRFCTFTNGDTEKGRRIKIRVTFRELLEFDLDHFPYTTMTQRSTIRSFEDQTMVSRDEVAIALSLSPDDEILKCIFGTLQELPGIVYDRLVSCLHDHPIKHNFAQTCANQIEQAKTNMSLVFASIIMLIVTLVVVPQLDIPTMYLVQRTSWDSTTGEFFNGCKNGNISDPTTCMLIKKTMGDVKTTGEILTFMRDFIAMELFPEDDVTKASDEDFFGTVRVGGIIMKTSPLENSKTREVEGAYLPGNPRNVACPLRSCEALNLTQTNQEFQISSFFSCDAFDRPNSITIIPFNASRPEALAIARTWEPWFCNDEDTQVTMQYALFQPSQQIVSWTTVSFTVPESGSVIPRTYTQTMNLNAKPLVRAFAGIHLSIFFWLLLIVALRRREPIKRFFTPQMLSEYFLSILNIISLSLIESLPDSIDEILKLVVQTEYVPPVDSFVATYSLAMDILGVWVLVFYIGACSMFSDVIGLNVITRLLKITAADVVVLLVLFSVIASSFLGIARVLFGTAVPEFSYSATTVYYLLGFLWGDLDFDSVSKQAPVAGSVFFFAFLAFIIIVVLNLLIAVITSRLEELRNKSNLHLEMYSQILQDASNFEGSERTWFNFRQSVLPIVNIIIDATPFIASTLRWKEFNRITSELFHPYSRKSLPPIHDVVKNSIELLQFMDKASPANFLTDDEYWNTTLRRAIDTYEPIDDRVSWLLLERVILSQSQYSIVRDAALIRVLISYDETNTDIEGVLQYQKEQEEQCRQDRERLAEGVSRRHQKFVDAYYNSNNYKNNNNNSPTASPPASPLVPKKKANDFPMATATTKKDDTNSLSSNSSANNNNNNSNNNNKDDKNTDDENATAIKHVTFSVNSNFEGFTRTPSGDSSTNNSSLAKQASSASEFARQVFETSQHNCVDNDLQKRKIHTGFKVSAAHQRFLTNQYVIRTVKGYLYFPLRSFLSLLLYCTFFFSLLLYDESASWLGSDIGGALADFPYVQQCLNHNCTRAFTFDKRFSDVGNLEDIQEYIRKLLNPKIFPASLPYNNSENPNSKLLLPGNLRMFAEESGEEMFNVYWDANLRRVGPITIRQVLGKRAVCQNPTRASLDRHGDPARTALFDGLTCYTSPAALLSSPFDVEPLERPPDSELSEDSYIFQNSCPEDSSVLGSYELYPCSGYSTKIHNSSQLLYSQEWLNPGAKLVVFSITFRSPNRQAQVRAIEQASAVAQVNGQSEIIVYTNRQNSEEVRLDLYIEQAAGGGGSRVWHYTNVADQPMFSNYSWMGFLNLGIDLAFFIFHTFRYLYYRFFRHHADSRSVEQSKQHWPDIPWLNLITLAAIIWLSAITTLQRQLRESWMLAVLVVSSTAMLMNNVVFPLAKIITYRALTLIRSLSLAGRLVLVIVPFYGVITVGFVFSGHLFFGRNIHEYSTLRLSLQSIGRGLLTDWNIASLYTQRPAIALFFAVCFFAVILVVLANLLLTLITQAVSEARDETKIVNFIQMAAEFSNQKVYTDEYVATKLAWHLAEHHLLARAFRRIRKRIRAKWRQLWKKDDEKDKDKNKNNNNSDDSNKKTIAERRRVSLTMGAMSDYDNNHREMAEDAVIDAAGGILPADDEEFERKVQEMLQQMKEAALKNSSRAMVDFETEMEEVMQRDERGGQFFVTGEGRFARALESLMFVCSPFRLQELAESLHLTSVSEDFIYSVALFLARLQTEFTRKYPEQKTNDNIEGAVLMSGFRKANSVAMLHHSISTDLSFGDIVGEPAVVTQKQEDAPPLEKSPTAVVLPLPTNNSRNQEEETQRHHDDDDEEGPSSPASPSTKVMKTTKVVVKRKKKKSNNSNTSASATSASISIDPAMMDDI